MKKFLVLTLLTLMLTKSFGQSKNNRHDRLTKDEFQELTKYRDNFIPTDLGDTVIIIEYSGQRFEQMQQRARNISFAKNGTDTTEINNETILTEKQLQKNKQMMSKFAANFPQTLKKDLKKKGVQSLILKETDLRQNQQYLKKYWLKTTFISTQESSADNGWVLTATNLFYDPRTNKDFEVFLPINYNLIELIK